MLHRKLLITTVAIVLGTAAQAAPAGSNGGTASPPHIIVPTPAPASGPTPQPTTRAPTESTTAAQPDTNNALPQSDNAPPPTVTDVPSATTQPQVDPPPH